MTRHRRLAAQNPPHRHIPARRAQVQQGRRRRTSSGEFSGSCWKCGQRDHRRSECRGERRTRSLEDVRTLSPTRVCCENCRRQGHPRATCWQLKDVMMVGGNANRLGGRTAVQPSRSRTPLCKVPPRCCCAGGSSVGRSGRPPLSPGGGHWCGKDLRQGRSSGSSKCPSVRPAVVWRDWPLYNASRPRGIYDHGGGC